MPEVLRACDALVSPVHYEAYGLNVQEAICCGLPALVSASAGIAEQYPAALADLLLPDPDDPADLAARLRRWRVGPGRHRPEVEWFSRNSAAILGTTWPIDSSRPSTRRHEPIRPNDRLRRARRRATEPAVLGPETRPAHQAAARPRAASGSPSAGWRSSS